MNRLWAALGLAFLLGTASVSSAQEDGILTLDTLVVTATRGDKSLKDAPGSVTVITKEDIAKRNALSIDALLKAVPGFYGRRDQGFSTLQPNVNIRGISGNRTLFMLDGLPLNDGRSGSIFFEGLPLETIEQVEAVKGASSALYGSQGLAGVINIRTMMPAETMFKVKTGYGSSWHRGEACDDMATYSLLYGDRLGERFAFLLSYNRSETNGFAYQKNVSTAKPGAGLSGYKPTTNSAGAGAYMWGDKGDGFSWSDSVSAKIQYDIDPDSSLNLSFIKTRNHVDYDEPHTLVRNAAGEPVYYPSQYSFLATASGRERNIYQGVYETSFGDISARLSLGLMDTSSYYNRSPSSGATLDGGPGSYLSAPGQAYSADLQFSAPFFSRQTLTWGLSYKYDSTAAKTYRLSDWKDANSKAGLSSREGGKSRTLALFLQDEISIGERLTVYAGGRIDWWKTWAGYYKTASSQTEFQARSQSSFSPKVALVYRPLEATSLKMSAGRAFNAPTLYQLYNKYIGTYTTSANPGLKPERVWSWDLSLTQGLWAGGEITVAYFENHLSDMIYTRVISSSLRERTNLGQARTRGLEVEFSQRLGDHLAFSSDYTYTDAKIKKQAADSSLNGKRLQDVPQHIWNLGLEAEYGPLSGFISGRYISKRYQTDGNTDSVNNVYGSYDPVFTAEAKLACQITERVSASVSVNNIFDRKYFNYYEAPGRSWFFDVSYSY